MKYSWKCQDCERITTLSLTFEEYEEVARNMERSSADVPVCRSCGKPRLVRVYNPILVVYHAKGFYSTGD